MTFSQLNKLISLSRCQLLVADTAFVRKLEAMPDCYALTAEENRKLNRLALDYKLQVKQRENMR